MPLLSELVRQLDRFAPPHLAAEWDNTGLVLGDPAASVERVLTCLTLTADVVAEAVTERADLIVSHHPILFRGAKKLTADRGDGAVVWPLAKAGIAVYSPHTSFDNCAGGINDMLCRRLGIVKPVPLRAGNAAKQFKLVVFVPDSDLSRVSDAVFAAGAGVIGQYEQCSFRLAGKGTFFGTDSTNPVVGEKGRREDVDEWRLEVVVPEAKLAAVVKAMRAAHSYEEPAFDVYPLHPAGGGGEGRIGELNPSLTLAELAASLKTAINASFLQTVGEASTPIRRVAVACGAAGEFLPDAIRAGADAFLTGEMRFHDALAARTAGIAVLLPGHYATERPGIEELAMKLAEDWPGVTTWASRIERDPLNSLS
ncbi:MAG: Nif3-like dinuclear metal center hexameric protein [Gemmataceae bacterium]